MYRYYLCGFLFLLLICPLESNATTAVTDLNLFFSNKMEAKVYINNNYLGIIEAGPDRPYKVSSLSEGVHNIKAIPLDDDYNAESTTFNIKIGTINSLEIMFKKKEKHAYLIFRFLVDFPAFNEYEHLPVKYCKKCGKEIGDPIGIPKSIYMAINKPKFFRVSIDHNSCFDANFNMHGDITTRIDSSNYTEFLCKESLVLNYKRIKSIIKSRGNTYIQSNKFTIEPGEIKVTGYWTIDGYKGEGFYIGMRLDPRTYIPFPERNFRAELGKTLVVTAYFNDVDQVYVEGHLE